jgi:hypothetical protein
LRQPIGCPADELTFWSRDGSFPCLHQNPRAPEEDEAFQAALRAMANAYAAPGTIVLQHKDIPFNATMDTRQVPYDRSGWCTMEQAAAHLCDRGLYKLGDGWVRTTWHSPHSMERAFKDPNRTTFHGAADRERVTKMYRRLSLLMVRCSFPE